MHSTGDSEIFNVQLLKMLTKIDPGSELRVEIIFPYINKLIKTLFFFTKVYIG